MCSKNHFNDDDDDDDNNYNDYDDEDADDVAGSAVVVALIKNDVVANLAALYVKNIKKKHLKNAAEQEFNNRIPIQTVTIAGKISVCLYIKFNYI